MVVLPSRVTGLAAISIMAEITFIPGFQVSSNSSQRGAGLGIVLAFDLENDGLRMTVLAISCFVSRNEIIFSVVMMRIQERDAGKGAIGPVTVRNRLP